MAGVLPNGLFVLSALLAARVLIDGFAGFRAAHGKLRAEMTQAQRPCDLHVRISRIDVEPVRQRREGPALGVVRMESRRPALRRRHALPVAA